MESYKDVIVSQPPAMYAQSGYTTQFSVENYKGILLCERPSNLNSVAGGGGGAAGSSSVNGATATPFIPSNPTGNPVGYAPSKEARATNAEHIAQRLSNQRQNQLKSNQALSRHRRWLRSFAKQMKQMKESDRQCEVEAARRAARIRDNEQQRRAEQQQQQQQQQHERATGAAGGADGAAASSQSGVAAPYNMRRAMEGHVAAARKTAAAARKPKWALTEEEALDAELDIDRDLLDFAEHLDYEKFISDFEVAEALGVMRDRVVQIARANDWSVDDIRRTTGDGGSGDDDDVDSTVTPSEAQVLLRRPAPAQPNSPAGARPAAPGSQAAHTHDWDSSTGRGRLLRKAISRDAVALAERLFAASPSLQKIHTKQSLARVLQQCALEGHVDVTEAMLLQTAKGKNNNNNNNGANPSSRAAAPAASSSPPPPALPEPVVVQISADAIPASGNADGSSAAPANPPRVLRELQQSKERTQGLPYLYRCPAI